MQSLTQSDLLILMSFSGSFNLASSGFLIAPFLIQFNNSIMSDSCYPMDCSMPGFPVHHQHPELAQTHIHQVGDAIQPSHPLCPLLLLFSIFPSIGVFSNESVLRMRRPKFWSFSFNINPSNEYSRLISFRMDWLDLLTVQGTLKSLLQHHSSKASILWCSVFFLEFPHSSVSKESACNAGGPGSIPEWERSAEEGNGNPLQYSCQENLMDRGA